MASFTNDDLIAIEKSIAKGVLTVKYTDKEITYRSLDDLFKIRNEIRKCLGLVNCGGGRTFAKHSKGLC